MYEVSPRHMRALVLEVLEAGLVPYIKGSPGVGKSDIIRGIAKDAGLKTIDHRVSTSAPEDFTGLPRITDNEAKMVPFKEIFPTSDVAIPPGFNGWILFLDELNSGERLTQAASYKLLLDKMVGQNALHKKVAIIAAGNYDTDRAITNPFGTAMQSRVITLKLKVDHKEWMEDYAIPNDFDSRIIAYLSQHKDHLTDFNPAHNEETFCCPRTWAFLNAIIKDKPVNDYLLPMYAGTITSGVAQSFVQFTSVFNDMIRIEDILRDPENAVVPIDSQTRWAVISVMMKHVTSQNFGKLAIYANKFPTDFKVLFYRATMSQHPELRPHPAFAKAMIELNRYLKD